MSFTFSAPGGPTEGLQGYNLHRPVLSLARETAFASKRSRWLRAKRRAKHSKRDSQMDETLTKMVETLKESVTSIMTAGQPDASDMLAKTFTEFEGALFGSVGETLIALEKRASDAGYAEAPLFKGYGAVGRIANLLKTVADHVEAIKAGKELWEVSGPGGSSSKAADQPGPMVEALLDRGLMFVSLALRAAVNDEVQITDDDDEAMIVMKVDDGADGLEVMLKSALPVELAEFATDPTDISNQIMDDAIETLIHVTGIPESALEKMFTEAGMEPMAKADGMPGARGGMAEAVDTNGDGEQSLQEKIVMIGRLTAATLLLVSEVAEKSGAGGGMGDETDMGAEGDMEGDEAGMGAEGDMEGEGEEPEAAEPKAEEDDGGEDEEKKKPPFGKSASNAGLAKLEARLAKQFQGTIDELNAKLAKVAGEPAPAKGALMAVGSSLSKAADGGGEAPMSEADIAAAVEKVPVAERAVVMFKLSQQQDPRVVLAKFL